MESRFTVVAINGSPHGGTGSTALMLDMLRQPLAERNCTLEVVTLCDHEIDYCTGCAHCLEKGQCWIPDDHRAIVERLLAADGVILASPVYFFHVTAQMKAFIDRSLAWGPGATNPGPPGSPAWRSASPPARGRPKPRTTWQSCCASTAPSPWGA